MKHKHLGTFEPSCEYELRAIDTVKRLSDRHHGNATRNKKRLPRTYVLQDTRTPSPLSTLQKGGRQDKNNFNNTPNWSTNNFNITYSGQGRLAFTRGHGSTPSSPRLHPNDKPHPKIELISFCNARVWNYLRACPLVQWLWGKPLRDLIIIWEYRLYYRDLDYSIAIMIISNIFKIVQVSWM